MKTLIFSDPNNPQLQIKVFLTPGSNQIFVVVTKE